MTLKYYNKSCSTRSTTLTYTMPTGYTLQTSTDSNYTVSGNTITYTLANVPSGARNTINITMTNTDSSLVLGDSVQHYVQIGDLGIDETPEMNYDSSYVYIRASFDPNQKSAIPVADLHIDKQTIHYLLAFENLGNDTAFFVKIVDTLSNLLNYVTFRITGSSHTYEYFMDEKFGHKIIRFEFPQIKLADSTDKLNNKGWISYSIDVIDALLKSDVIYNTAYIYFDNNQPIITNTTRHQILPVSVQSPEWTQNINVYPNPINDYLIIEDQLKMIENVIVRNILGQVIHVPIIETQSGYKRVNTSTLSNGIYIIELRNSIGQAHVMKIIK